MYSKKKSIQLSNSNKKKRKELQYYQNMLIIYNHDFIYQGLFLMLNFSLKYLSEFFQINKMIVNINSLADNKCKMTELDVCDHVL